MELIIVAGKRLVDDMDWMQDEREHHVMQQITQQYLCVEQRWKQLLSRSQEWGGLLDNLYPEMKQCQVILSKCSFDVHTYIHAHTQDCHINLLLITLYIVTVFCLCT